MWFHPTIYCRVACPQEQWYFSVLFYCDIMFWNFWSRLIHWLQFWYRITWQVKNFYFCFLIFVGFLRMALQLSKIRAICNCLQSYVYPIFDQFFTIFGCHLRFFFVKVTIDFQRLCCLEKCCVFTSSDNQWFKFLMSD